MSQVNQDKIEKDFTDFWANIVCDANGNLDAEKVKRELYDFHTAMKEVSKVYFELTSGKFSKINTKAEYIIEATRDNFRQLFEPKPDESRLLADEEIGKTLARAKEGYWTFKEHPMFEIEKEILKAQDAKTASIKEAECQQRVERIFREIESHATESIAIKDSDTEQQMEIRAIPSDWWQTFGKQEGIRNADSKRD